MSADEQLLKTIDLVYEASLDGDVWKDVVVSFCELTKSPRGVMALTDKHGYLYDIIHGIDPGLEPIAEQLLRTNPYHKRRSSVPSGSAALGCQVATRKEIEESPFFQEVYRPAGCFDLCGIIFHNEPDLLGDISAFRDRGQERYGRRELAYANTLAPHVRRAVKISGLLEQSSPWAPEFASLAEHFTFGLMLVGRSGDVHYANSRAESLLLHGRVGSRSRRGGVAGSSIRRNLRPLIDEARRTRRPVAKTLNRAGKLPLQLVVFALPSRAKHLGLISQRAEAAVLLLDAIGQGGLPVELIGRLYRLTSAELRIVEALLSGTRPVEIARQAGLSRNTVKTQLHSIYQKVGVSGHAALITRLGPVATISDRVSR